MPKSNIHDAQSVSFATTDQIVVDANIWLYLFAPPSNPAVSGWIARSYPPVFKRLCLAGAGIILDQLILSEYLNRYSRIEHRALFTAAYPFFKDFRKSPDFKPIAAAAAVFAKKIISKCRLHGTCTDTLDFPEAVNRFEAGVLDFNDAILVDICRKNNFKLLTNDTDFYDADIEIITCNRNLLR